MIIFLNTTIDTRNKDNDATNIVTYAYNNAAVIAATLKTNKTCKQQRLHS